MNVKDYTNAPLGTKDGLNEVKECPHCHLHALEVVSNGATSYKHRYNDGYDAEGIFRLGWVFCPDGPPVRTGPPDETLD
jgi:hypothetical protein